MSHLANPTKKSKPWQLIAILLATVIPIVAAYVAYYTGIGVPDERVNEGTLLTPAKNLQDLLPQAQGEVPGFDKNYLWRILIPITGTCNEACAKNLYTTRQVHIRLAQNAERVERYAVNLGGDSGDQFLQEIAAEHPLLKHFAVDQKTWDEWLQDANVPADLNAEPYYILVDQVGFTVTMYNAEHDGNQLLKDIKRVLRYSPEK